MARTSDLDKMSYAELSAMELRIARMQDLVRAVREVRVRRNRRRVHKSLHPHRLGCSQQIFRPLHIGRRLHRRVRLPHAGVGRRMKNRFATGLSCRQGCNVSQVGANRNATPPGDGLVGLRTTRQCPDLEASRAQLAQ